MMQLIINAAGEIMEYVVTGGIRGAVKFSGVIPGNFLIEFKPAYYLLKGNDIVLNPDYKDPATPNPIETPSPQDEINAMLLREAASLHARLGGNNNA